MRLTFLGTSAGESYPGLWCDCPHCTYARTHGGRNLRANSCAVLDDTLLLDMGSGCFNTAARQQISLSQVRVVLVTHPHEDHFYPKHLQWRHGADENMHLPFAEQMHRGGPRFTPVPPLTLYGNAYTEKALYAWQENIDNLHMRFVRIEEGKPFTDSGYTVTPVRGNHWQKGFAHSYIVEKDGRTMLYALDTGSYDEDMQGILKKHTFNLIVMEGTGGLNTCGDGHMCLAKNVDMLDFFVKNGCYAPDGRFVLTHMSPHWTPPHDIYETIAEKEGMIVAYDGMEIEV